MNNKILFLDFDGVMIPRRAYYLPNQTRPTVTTFDPSSVSLLNVLCNQFKLKIVLITSWRRIPGEWFLPTLGKDAITLDLVDHCVGQGITREYFHNDPQAPIKGNSTSKYDDASAWLVNHPEVTEYVIIDDDLENTHFVHGPNIITPDFDEGLNYDIFRRIRHHFDPVAKRKYEKACEMGLIL